MRFAEPILLTTGLGQILRVVKSPHDDRVRCVTAHKIDYIGTERRIAPLVCHRNRIVHPYRRDVIDRAEVQNQSPTISQIGPRKGTAIPDGVEKTGFLDSARGCFWSERDRDRAIEADLRR